MPFVDPAGYSSIGYSSIGYSVTLVEPSPEAPPPTELTGVASGRRLRLKTMELLRSTRPTRTMHSRQYIGFSRITITVGRVYLSRSTVSLQIPRRPISTEIRTQIPSSRIHGIWPKVVLQPSRLTLQTQSVVLSSVSMLRLGNADIRTDRLRRLQKTLEITSILI